MYHEVEDPRTGEVSACQATYDYVVPSCKMVFESWEGSGPLHGQKVATPYPSKDQLQQKRSIAQTMDTTYVYDFVELFRQVD